MTPERFTLKNGMRVVHLENSHSPILHCGFLIDVGSRDEEEDEHGLAHFMEHVFFKGTKKRKVYHILNRLEVLGGELNAYTTKEDTCLHASVLKEYAEHAIELLADILFHSVFPEKEVEKEKEVIIDEINSYNDQPVELIFETFDELMFPKHTLGKPILGTKESVSSFNREKVLAFLKKNYSSDKIVFSCTGNISSKKLKSLLEKYVEPFLFSPEKRVQRKKPTEVGQFNTTLEKEITQLHYVMGTKAYSIKNPKSKVLTLLNNILGGPAMNSRLNMILREKKGLTYHTESSYSSFNDIGLFNIYLGTDPKNLAASKEIIKREMNSFRTQKLTPRALSLAKKQLIGQFLMGQENQVNLILSMAKSILIFDRIDTNQQVIKKVESITPEMIMEVSNEILNFEHFNELVFKPN